MSRTFAVEFTKKRKYEYNNDCSSSTSPPPSSNRIPQDIRNILEPLTKDQLIDILQSAAFAHYDVLNAVCSVADLDVTSRRLFIRGLAGGTTCADLRDAFYTYGPMEEANMVFEKATCSSKGYGFVTYKHVEGAVMELKEPSKKIKGRMKVAKLASNGNSTKENDAGGRKIYVGNAPLDVSPERLLSHFERYGEVEQGPVGFERVRGKSKGFAFFMYETEEGARASLVQPIKVIDGHEVYCRLADDGNKAKPMQPTPTRGFSGDNHHYQYQQQQLPSEAASQYHHHDHNHQQLSLSSVPQYRASWLGMQSPVGYPFGGYVHGVGGFAPNPSVAFCDCSEHQWHGMFQDTR